MSDRIKTQQILSALRQRHMNEQGNGLSKTWVYAEEVRVSTGFSSNAAYWRKLQKSQAAYQDQYPTELLGAGEQRIDAFALHTWPSKAGLRIAYEVKASTADLRKELSDESKSAAARFLSNQFYLVVHTDARLVLADIPNEWGVIRYDPSKGLRQTKAAPLRETDLPPYSFMLSLARNLQAQSLKQT